MSNRRFKLSELGNSPVWVYWQACPGEGESFLYLVLPSSKYLIDTRWAWIVTPISGEHEMDESNLNPYTFSGWQCFPKFFGHDSDPPYYLTPTPHHIQIVPLLLERFGMKNSVHIRKPDIRENKRWYPTELERLAMQLIMQSDNTS